MKFEDKYGIIYCKDMSYCINLDKKDNFIFDIEDKLYYKGYLVHRINGPAIEYKNGNKEWRFEGRLHRIDGPTIEWNWGAKDFYLNESKVVPGSIHVIVP